MSYLNAPYNSFIYSFAVAIYKQQEHNILTSDE